MMLKKLILLACVMSIACAPIAYAYSGDSAIEKNTTRSDGLSVTKKEALEKNLTINNSTDFAKILSTKASDSSACDAFVKKYIGRTIEFDGRIDNLGERKNTKNIYDVLLSSESEIAGNPMQARPVFKYSGVSKKELGCSPFIRTGAKVHVIAAIDQYDPKTGVFYLDPVALAPEK